MVERMWLGNWLVQAWEVLFQPDGFGPVPEKLRASPDAVCALRLDPGPTRSVAKALHPLMQPAAAGVQVVRVLCHQGKGPGTAAGLLPQVPAVHP